MMKNLYKKALDVYFKFKPHQTKDWEKYWSNRKYGKDWLNEQDDWVDGYWKSVDHPHRRLLCDAVIKRNPITVLELGCNCGVNLLNVSNKLPQSECFGLDISADAVNKGRALFRKYNINNVYLFNGMIDKLNKFRNLKFDVIFTDACLIYIGQDKIESIIGQMCARTKRIVLLERMIFGKEGSIYKDGLWHRDYIPLIRKFWGGISFNITKITDKIWHEWSECGYLIEVWK